MAALILLLERSNPLQAEVAKGMTQRLPMLNWSVRLMDDDCPEEYTKAKQAAAKEDATILFYILSPKTGATWARSLENRLIDDPLEIGQFLHEAALDYARFADALTNV